MYQTTDLGNDGFRTTHGIKHGYRADWMIAKGAKAVAVWGPDGVRKPMDADEKRRYEQGKRFLYEGLCIKFGSAEVPKKLADQMLMARKYCGIQPPAQIAGDMVEEYLAERARDHRTIYGSADVRADKERLRDSEK